MTTIAWDGTYLAADRQATRGNVTSDVGKIFVGTKFVFAGCGDLGEMTTIGQWIAKGARGTPPIVDGDSGVLGVAVRRSDKQLFVVYGPLATMCPLGDTLYAAGSGCDFALAAMHLGHDASEAVGFASKLDVFTGETVDRVKP